MAFRALYPEGDNFVVAHDVGRAHQRRIAGLSVRFVGIGHLAGLRALGGDHDA